LDGKGNKSRNLAFWAKKEFTILDRIWTKNGKMTTGKIVKIDYSRRNWRRDKFVADESLSPHLLPLLIAAWGDPPLLPPLSTPLGAGK